MDDNIFYRDVLFRTDAGYFPVHVRAEWLEQFVVERATGRPDRQFPISLEMSIMRRDEEERVVKFVVHDILVTRELVTMEGG